MARLDSLEEIVCCVVHARNDVGVALSVGCPEDNDFVKVVDSLEIPGMKLDRGLSS